MWGYVVTPDTPQTLVWRRSGETDCCHCSVWFCHFLDITTPGPWRCMTQTWASKPKMTPIWSPHNRVLCPKWTQAKWSIHPTFCSSHPSPAHHLERFISPSLPARIRWCIIHNLNGSATNWADPRPPGHPWLPSAAIRTLGPLLSYWVYNHLVKLRNTVSVSQTPDITTATLSQLAKKIFCLNLTGFARNWPR